MAQFVDLREKVWDLHDKDFSGIGRAQSRRNGVTATKNLSKEDLKKVQASSEGIFSFKDKNGVTWVVTDVGEEGWPTFYERISSPQVGEFFSTRRLAYLAAKNQSGLGENFDAPLTQVLKLRLSTKKLRQAIANRRELIFQNRLAQAKVDAQENAIAKRDRLLAQNQELKQGQQTAPVIKEVAPAPAEEETPQALAWWERVLTSVGAVPLGLAVGGLTAVLWFLGLGKALKSIFTSKKTWLKNQVGFKGSPAEWDRVWNVFTARRENTSSADVPELTDEQFSRARALFLSGTTAVAIAMSTLFGGTSPTLRANDTVVQASSAQATENLASLRAEKKKVEDEISQARNKKFEAGDGRSFSRQDLEEKLKIWSRDTEEDRANVEAWEKIVKKHDAEQDKRQSQVLALDRKIEEMIPALPVANLQEEIKKMEARIREMENKFLRQPDGINFYSHQEITKELEKWESSDKRVLVQTGRDSETAPFTREWRKRYNTKEAEIKRLEGLVVSWKKTLPVKQEAVDSPKEEVSVVPTVESSPISLLKNLRDQNRKLGAQITQAPPNHPDQQAWRDQILANNQKIYEIIPTLPGPELQKEIQRIESRIQEVETHFLKVGGELLSRKNFLIRLMLWRASYKSNPTDQARTNLQDWERLALNRSRELETLEDRLRSWKELSNATSELAADSKEEPGAVAEDLAEVDKPAKLAELERELNQSLSEMKETYIPGYGIVKLPGGVREKIAEADLRHVALRSLLSKEQRSLLSEAAKNATGDPLVILYRDTRTGKKKYFPFMMGKRGFAKSRILYSSHMGQLAFSEAYQEWEKTPGGIATSSFGVFEESSIDLFTIGQLKDFLYFLERSDKYRSTVSHISNLSQVMRSEQAAEEAAIRSLSPGPGLLHRHDGPAETWQSTNGKIFTTPRGDALTVQYFGFGITYDPASPDPSREYDILLEADIARVEITPFGLMIRTQNGAYKKVNLGAKGWTRFMNLEIDRALMPMRQPGLKYYDWLINQDRNRASATTDKLADLMLLRQKIAKLKKEIDRDTSTADFIQLAKNRRMGTPAPPGGLEFLMSVATADEDDLGSIAKKAFEIWRGDVYAKKRALIGLVTSPATEGMYEGNQKGPGKFFSSKTSQKHFFATEDELPLSVKSRWESPTEVSGVPGRVLQSVSGVWYQLQEGKERKNFFVVEGESLPQEVTDALAASKSSVIVSPGEFIPQHVASFRFYEGDLRTHYYSSFEDLPETVEMVVPTNLKGKSKLQKTQARERVERGQDVPVVGGRIKYKWGYGVDTSTQKVLNGANPKDTRYEFMLVRFYNDAEMRRGKPAYEIVRQFHEEELQLDPSLSSYQAAAATLDGITRLWSDDALLGNEVLVKYEPNTITEFDEEYNPIGRYSVRDLELNRGIKPLVLYEIKEATYEKLKAFVDPKVAERLNAKWARRLQDHVIGLDTEKIRRREKEALTQGDLASAISVGAFEVDGKYYLFLPPSQSYEKGHPLEGVKMVPRAVVNLWTGAMLDYGWLGIRTADQDIQAPFYFGRLQANVQGGYSTFDDIRNKLGLPTSITLAKGNDTALILQEVMSRLRQQLRVATDPKDKEAILEKIRLVREEMAIFEANPTYPRTSAWSGVAGSAGRFLPIVEQLFINEVPSLLPFFNTNHQWKWSQIRFPTKPVTSPPAASSTTSGGARLSSEVRAGLSRRTFMQWALSSLAAIGLPWKGAKAAGPTLRNPAREQEIREKSEALRKLRNELEVVNQFLKENHIPGNGWVHLPDGSKKSVTKRDLIMKVIPRSYLSSKDKDKTPLAKDAETASGDPLVIRHQYQGEEKYYLFTPGDFGLDRMKFFYSDHQMQLILSEEYKKYVSSDEYKAYIKKYPSKAKESVQHFLQAAIVLEPIRAQRKSLEARKAADQVAPHPFGIAYDPADPSKVKILDQEDLFQVRKEGRSIVVTIDGRQWPVHLGAKGWDWLIYLKEDEALLPFRQRGIQFHELLIQMKRNRIEAMAKKRDQARLLREEVELLEKEINKLIFIDDFIIIAEKTRVAVKPDVDETKGEPRLEEAVAKSEGDELEGLAGKMFEALEGYSYIVRRALINLALSPATRGMYEGNKTGPGKFYSAKTGLIHHFESSKDLPESVRAAWEKGPQSKVGIPGKVLSQIKGTFNGVEGLFIPAHVAVYTPKGNGAPYFYYPTYEDIDESYESVGKIDRNRKISYGKGPLRAEVLAGQTVFTPNGYLQKSFGYFADPWELRNAQRMAKDDIFYEYAIVQARTPEEMAAGKAPLEIVHQLSRKELESETRYEPYRQAIASMEDSKTLFSPSLPGGQIVVKYVVHGAVEMDRLNHPIVIHTKDDIESGNTPLSELYEINQQTYEKIKGPIDEKELTDLVRKSGYGAGVEPAEVVHHREAATQIRQDLETLRRANVFEWKGRYFTYLRPDFRQHAPFKEGDFTSIGTVNALTGAKIELGYTPLALAANQSKLMSDEFYQLRPGPPGEVQLPLETLYPPSGFSHLYDKALRPVTTSSFDQSQHYERIWPNRDLSSINGYFAWLETVVRGGVLKASDLRSPGDPLNIYIGANGEVELAHRRAIDQINSQLRANTSQGSRRDELLRLLEVVKKEAQLPPQNDNEVAGVALYGVGHAAKRLSAYSTQLFQGKFLPIDFFGKKLREVRVPILVEPKKAATPPAAGGARLAERVLTLSPLVTGVKLIFVAITIYIAQGRYSKVSPVKSNVPGITVAIVAPTEASFRAARAQLTRFLSQATGESDDAVKTHFRLVRTNRAPDFVSAAAPSKFFVVVDGKELTPEVGARLAQIYQEDLEIQKSGLIFLREVFEQLERNPGEIDRTSMSDLRAWMGVLAKLVQRPSSVTEGLQIVSGPRRQIIESNGNIVEVEKQIAGTVVTAYQNQGPDELLQVAEELAQYASRTDRNPESLYQQIAEALRQKYNQELASLSLDPGDYTVVLHESGIRVEGKTPQEILKAVRAQVQAILEHVQKQKGQKQIRVKFLFAATSQETRKLVSDQGGFDDVVLLTSQQAGSLDGVISAFKNPIQGRYVVVARKDVVSTGRVLADNEFLMNIIPVKSNSFGGTMVAAFALTAKGREAKLPGLTALDGNIYNYKPFLVLISEMIEEIRAQQQAVGSAA